MSMPMSMFGKRIDSLQTELTSLQEKLESETEETEKERLVSLIQEINGKIEVIRTAQEEFIAATNEEEEPRKE